MQPDTLSNSRKKATIENDQKKVATKYQITLKTLSDKFPKVFIKDEVRILKVGIYKDIKKATDLKSAEINKFLYEYCNSEAYKEAHMEGTPRYDLNGNIAGTVTAEEAYKKTQPKNSNINRNQIPNIAKNT
jgi:sRNA-binding protein